MERKKLVVARLQKNWTQEQVAGFLGTDVATLSRWERGKSRPHPYNIQRLCDLYGKAAWELELDIEQHINESNEIANLNQSSVLNSFYNDLMMRFLILILSNQRISFSDLEALQKKFTNIVEEMDAMNTENRTYQITRRETLHKIASLPLLALGLDANRPVLQHPVEDILTQTAAGITACGYLSKGGREEMSLAMTALSAYLPSLIAIIKDSSQHRRAAAHLASQAAFMLAMLTVHNSEASAAIKLAQQAVTFSKQSSDLPLQLFALKRLGWVYACSNQYVQAAQTAASMKHEIDTTRITVPSAVQRLTYGGIAKFSAQNGQKEQALAAIKSAYNHLMSSDEEPLYATHNVSDLFLDTGLAYYYLGEYQKAFDTFSEVIDPDTLENNVAASSERVRIEIINQQTLASLKLPRSKKDKELSIKLWKAGIQGAKELQSEQRFSEALRAYDMIEALWGDDNQVIELYDLTRHW